MKDQLLRHQAVSVDPAHLNLISSRPFRHQRLETSPPGQPGPKQPPVQPPPGPKDPPVKPPGPKQPPVIPPDPDKPPVEPPGPNEPPVKPPGPKKPPRMMLIDSTELHDLYYKIPDMARITRTDYW